MSKSEPKNIKNQKLRNLRKQYGITQQELADYLNMSRGVYQYLETKGIITGDILVKLSRFFGVPASTILEDGSKDMNNDFVQVKEPMRLHEPDYRNVTHIILSEDEKKVLQLYDKLSPEDKLLVQGYLSALVAKSN